MTIFRFNCFVLLAALLLPAAAFSQTAPPMPRQSKSVCEDYHQHISIDTARLWTMTQDRPLVLNFAPSLPARSAQPDEFELRAEAAEIYLSPSATYELVFSLPSNAQPPASTDVHVALIRVQRQSDARRTTLFETVVDSFCMQPEPAAEDSILLEFSLTIPNLIEIYGEVDSMDDWFYPKRQRARGKNEAGEPDYRRFRTLSGRLYQNSDHSMFGAIQLTPRHSDGLDPINSNAIYRALMNDMPGATASPSKMFNSCDLRLNHRLEIDLTETTILNPYFDAVFDADWYSERDFRASLTILQDPLQQQTRGHFEISERQSDVSPWDWFYSFDAKATLTFVGEDSQNHFVIHRANTDAFVLEQELNSTATNYNLLVAANNWRQLMRSIHKIEGWIDVYGNTRGHFVIDLQWFRLGRSLGKIDPEDYTIVEEDGNFYVEVPFDVQKATTFDELERLDCDGNH